MRIAPVRRQVGAWSSSFSYALREFRALAGRPRSTTLLVFSDRTRLFVRGMGLAVGHDVDRPPAIHPAAVRRRKRERAVNPEGGGGSEGRECGAVAGRDVFCPGR